MRFHSAATTATSPPLDDEDEVEEEEEREEEGEREEKGTAVEAALEAETEDDEGTLRK